MTTLDTGPWMQAGAALAGVLLLLWIAARLARRTGLAGRGLRFWAVVSGTSSLVHLF